MNQIVELNAVEVTEIDGAIIPVLAYGALVIFDVCIWAYALN